MCRVADDHASQLKFGRTIVLDNVSSDLRVSEIQGRVNDKIFTLLRNTVDQANIMIIILDVCRHLAKGNLRLGARDLVDESLTLGACGVKKEATLVKTCGHRLRGGSSTKDATNPVSSSAGGSEGGGAGGSVVEQTQHAQLVESSAGAKRTEAASDMAGPREASRTLDMGSRSSAAEDGTSEQDLTAARLHLVSQGLVYVWLVLGCGCGCKCLLCVGGWGGELDGWAWVYVSVCASVHVCFCARACVYGLSLLPPPPPLAVCVFV